LSKAIFLVGTDTCHSVTLFLNRIITSQNKELFALCAFAIAST